MSGMRTVVFYARLWRRAGVMTDAEFAELRYSGRPAAFLRGFRACYLALPINSIIMGWADHRALPCLLAGLRAARPQCGVDARADLLRLCGGELVGVLVPGVGAGRGR